MKKKEKKSKTSEKKENKESSVVKNLVDSSQKPTPSAREDPAPKKSNNEPARKPVEDKSEEGNASAPGPEPKQVTTPTARKSGKQVSQPAPVIPPQPPSTAPPRKEVPKTTPSEPKKKQPPPPEAGEWGRQEGTATPEIPAKNTDALNGLWKPEMCIFKSLVQEN